MGADWFGTAEVDGFQVGGAGPWKANPGVIWAEIGAAAAGGVVLPGAEPRGHHARIPGGHPARDSAGLVALESDEPVEAVTVDDLPVGCAPWPLLQVVHDAAAFAETGEPVAQ